MTPVSVTRTVLSSVRSALGPDRTIVDPELPLPDDEEVRGRHLGMVFDPGAADAIRAADLSSDERWRRALMIMRLISEAGTAPSSWGQLQEVLREDCVRELVTVLEPEVRSGQVARETALVVGRRLLIESETRGGVKLGLVLLAGQEPAALSEDDWAIVRQLGVHPEFTAWACDVIRTCSSAPDEEIWQIAQRTSMWGRVYAIWALGDDLPHRIQHWVLHEGRQAFMEEYVAFAVATKGRLARELAAEEPGLDVLIAAGSIIAALVYAQDWPAGGIGDYPEGARVVADYLQHLAAAGGAVAGADRTVVAIRDLLRSEECPCYASEDQQEGHEEPGWSPALCRRLVALCDSLIGSDEGRD